MSEQTKIQWADDTINFWSGCTKVSDGCKNCYAETLAGRFTTFGQWGKGAPRKWHESAVKLAHKLNRQPWICDDCGMAHANPGQICMTKDCQCETRHRRRIFSLSLGDWLDPEVPIEWLAKMLDVVRQCPDVDWLLVTKRPELFQQRMKALLDAWMEKDATIWPETKENDFWWFVESWKNDGHAPKNIMVLTSVENQKAADERIPELLKIPASRRGLSVEPLLGPVDLFKTFRIHPARAEQIALALDWIIIGGESGAGARPCNVDWIRSIKDQCKASGVPVFVKQLGANPEWAGWSESHGYRLASIRDKKGGDMAEWPEGLRVREFYHA